MCGGEGDVRLSDRVGLEGRLGVAGLLDEVKDIGMPSRITSLVPLTESGISSRRFGSGRLESGPAMLCSTS
jgi:hypothetical protein